MNKSIISSFKSLVFLSFALCTNIAVTPPALAETCMTDSLMMVYEPVESAKPKARKAKSKVTVANHKQSQLRQASVKTKPADTVVQASYRSSSKHVVSKTAENAGTGDAT